MATLTTINVIRGDAEAAAATRDAMPERTAQDDSVRESPSEVDVDDYIKNSSILYQLIIEHSWDAVIERCKATPEESQEWVVRESGEVGEDSWRRLPLHEACVRKANPKVIEALLLSYPEAARAEDHSGRLPIHHACFHGCSKEAVRKLICAYTEGSSKIDKYNKTPKTIAQSSSSKNKSEIIELLTKDPEETLVDSHRSNWKEEQEQILSDLRAGFEKERAKHLNKVNSLNAEIQKQRYKHETDVRLLRNQNRPQIDLLVKEHRYEKQKVIAQHKQALEMQRAIYEEKIQTLEQQSDVHVQHIDEMKKEIAMLAESLQEKSISEENLRGRVEFMEEALAEITARDVSLTQRNSELQAELAISNIEASSTLHELSSSVEKETSMSAEIKKLIQQLAAEKVASRKLNHVIESCRTENGSLMDQVSAYRDGLAMMQVKAEYFKNRFDESSQETVKKVREENASLVSDTEELKQLLGEKEAELKVIALNLEDSLAKLVTITRDSQKKFQDMEDSNQELIAARKEEADQLISKVDTLTAEVEDLTASVEKTKEELKKEQIRSKEALMMFQSLWKSNGPKPVVLK